MNFEAFPKIARLSREVIVTEKIDGTNAQVHIMNLAELSVPVPQAPILAEQDGHLLFAGSRKRYITPDDDNYGFAAWVQKNAEELFKLGPGRHYGEWWGKGIQRNYGLEERRFSLFNVSRWSEERPACCHVVPFLGKVDAFNTNSIQHFLDDLKIYGSMAARGFMNPEGIVIYHTQSNTLFKKMIENDHLPKGAQ